MNSTNLRMGTSIVGLVVSRGLGWTKFVNIALLSMEVLDICFQLKEATTSSARLIPSAASRTVKPAFGSNICKPTCSNRLIVLAVAMPIAQGPHMMLWQLVPTSRSIAFFFIVMILYRI